MVATPLPTLRHYPGLDNISHILIEVVQELSLANSITEVMRIVRHAARKLVHADGATFVLREEELCYYADEDAISGLWKGMRFPLRTCISGWCMLHKEQVKIRDIYQDERIPHDAYRPTFVKSLAMTPIRKADPIGAIGTYWAVEYTPTPQELDGLQALADSTAIAIQNLEMIKELRHRVTDLEHSNHRLSRMTWMVSHDLKEPLRSLNMRISLLQQQLRSLNPEREDDWWLMHTSQWLKHLDKMAQACDQGDELIRDVLTVAQIDNHERALRDVDLNALLCQVLTELGSRIENSGARIRHADLPTVYADPVLLARVLQNLLSNAIKFQPPGQTPDVVIQATQTNKYWRISVRDNGIGIEERYHEKLFEFFTRLHNKSEYPGSGVGLALCKLIVEGFGGAIRIESSTGKGSCFHIDLPRVLV